MSNNAFKDEVDMHKEFLTFNHAVMMPIEEDRIGICKEIKRVHDKKFDRVPFDFNSIKSLFLGNIKVLGAGTQEFYNDLVPKIRINRHYSFRNGDAQMIGNSIDQIMYVTARPFKDVDFVIASHEYGHLPTMINPSKNEKEYYEYLEVLSMYLEYLAFIKQKGIKEGERQFVAERLMDLKDDIDSFFRDHKKIKGNGSIADQAYETRKCDAYKYVKSFEYVLQLIERAKEDQKTVNSLIDEVVVGENTMRGLRTPLEIDTRGCKKLLSLIPKK